MKRFPPRSARRTGLRRAAATVAPFHLPAAGAPIRASLAAVLAVTVAIAWLAGCGARPTQPTGPSATTRLPARPTGLPTPFGPTGALVPTVVPTGATVPASTTGPGSPSPSPSPGRPVVATVGGTTTAFFALNDDGAWASLPGGTFRARGMTSMGDGRLLVTDDRGDLLLATRDQLLAGTWERLGASVGRTGDPSALVPEDDRQGGLVALRVVPGEPSLLLHLSAAGRPTGRQRIDASLDGIFEPLADGRTLLVRRARDDSPTVAILGLDGILRDTGTQAYDVVIGGGTAVVQQPVTELRAMSVTDLLEGRDVATALPGVLDATPERFAVDPSGTRLLVAWRDDRDTLRWVTLLVRAEDGTWNQRATMDLPAATERAFVAWVR